MGEPTVPSESDEEDDAAEGEFHCHGNPDALQSHVRGKQCGRDDAQEPDAREVHGAGDECVACADEDAVADDAGSKHGFGKCLYAEYLHRELLHCHVGRHDVEQGWRCGVHDDGHQRHECYAHAQCDAAKTACQISAAGAEALAYKGGGCVGHAIAGHVAEGFHGDAETVGGNGYRAEWCHDDGTHNLCAAQDDVLHGNGGGDVKPFAQGAQLGDEGAAVLPEREFFAPYNREVAHQQ